MMWMKIRLLKIGLVWFNWKLAPCSREIGCVMVEPEISSL